MTQVLDRVLHEVAFFPFDLHSLVFQPGPDFRQIVEVRIVVLTSNQDVVYITDHLGMPWSMVSMIFWNAAGADATPKGKRLYVAIETLGHVDRAILS